VRHHRARDPLPRYTGYYVFRRLQGFNPRQSQQLQQVTVSALLNDLPLLGFFLLMGSIPGSERSFHFITAVLRRLLVTRGANSPSDQEQPALRGLTAS
jgi:hypothetical protein